MMPHGGNWGAPSVIAALAGFVHDRKGTANYERNDNNDGYYGSVHCNLPAAGPKLHWQLTTWTGRVPPAEDGTVNDS